jgi:hypothetical protein
MGLVVSGPLVPRLVNSYGDQGWRITWFVLAGITFCSPILAFAVIRSLQEPVAQAEGRRRTRARIGIQRGAASVSVDGWRLSGLEAGVSSLRGHLASSVPSTSPSVSPT